MSETNNTNNQDQAPEQETDQFEQTANKTADDLGALFKMGVGAVADAVGKGVSFVKDLTSEGTETNRRASELGQEWARKGDEALSKTVEIGSQLKDSLIEKLSSVVAPDDFDGWIKGLNALSDEQLNAVKQKVDELLAERQKQPNAEA